MHLYYRSNERLRLALTEFTEGQFSMVTKEGLVFRGEIQSCVIPKNSLRQIFISFAWLCERRFVFNNLWTPKPKWSLLGPPTGESMLEVGFSFYYLQPEEERIKIWSELGEVCRFYKKNDYTNLVRNGDSFVPYAILHAEKLRLVLIDLLVHK